MKLTRHHLHQKTLEHDWADVLWAWSTSGGSFDNTTASIKGQFVLTLGTYSTERRHLAGANESILIPSALMELPLQERRAILRKAAAQAERDYVGDPDLTDFHAFDDADLFDETP